MAKAKGKLWVNTKFKKYKKWVARGSYSVKRGDRYYKLTNINGNTVVYESHESAKASGWQKFKAK